MDTDQRITAIEEDLTEIKSMLSSIKATLVSADDTIKKVAAEVMPTLNQVMESPMLRMLTGGKKK
jgi:hypothetical protein